MSQRNPKVSLATARVIPVLLVLVASYGSYVVVGPLSINYLLNPPDGQEADTVTGLAIPIAYFILLLPVAASWLRLTLVVLNDPGYIPQGPDRAPPGESGTNNPPGLEYFWQRDAFICDQGGLPIWCSYCKNWKPDRTHHNQDVGRCTRKMDHFCPWVGGVVGENSMKFFIQFTGYTALFTAYVMIVFAYFIAQHEKNAQWIVAVGLSGFFLFFTLGMFVNSTYLACLNYTTIEHSGLGSYRKTYMAVILPPDQQRDPLAPPPPARLASYKSDVGSDRPLTSDLDDPSHVSYFEQSNRSFRRPSPATPKEPSKIRVGTVTYPLELPVDRPPLPAPTPRTFAILELPPRMNPWKLENPWRNLAEVFGSTPAEWFLPIKRSPCCDHSSMVSEYPLGPAFVELLEEAGLTKQQADEFHDVRSPPRRRRRRRILDPGWQNGERPDGWISEKEARRIRHQERRQERDSRPDLS